MGCKCITLNKYFNYCWKKSGAQGAHLVWHCLSLAEQYTGCAPGQGPQPLHFPFFFFSETLSGVRIAPSEHVTMQASAILRMVWTTEKGFLEVHTDADSSQEPLSGVSTALLLEEGEPPFQPAQHPATWSSHLVTQQKTLSLFT